MGKDGQQNLTLRSVLLCGMQSSVRFGAVCAGRRNRLVELQKPGRASHRSQREIEIEIEIKKVQETMLLCKLCHWSFGLPNLVDARC